VALEESILLFFYSHNTNVPVKTFYLIFSLPSASRKGACYALLGRFSLAMKNEYKAFIL
jgi:hypothetical protein